MRGAVKKWVTPTLLSMCVSTHRRQPNYDAVQALVGNHLAAQAAGRCQPKGKVQHVVLIVTRLLCGGVTPASRQACSQCHNARHRDAMPRASFVCLSIAP